MRTHHAANPRRRDCESQVERCGDFPLSGGNAGTVLSHHSFNCCSSISSTASFHPLLSLAWWASSLVNPCTPPFHPPSPIMSSHFVHPASNARLASSGARLLEIVVLVGDSACEYTGAVATQPLDKCCDPAVLSALRRCTHERCTWCFMTCLLTCQRFQTRSLQ